MSKSTSKCATKLKSWPPDGLLLDCGPFRSKAMALTRYTIALSVEDDARLGRRGSIHPGADIIEQAAPIISV